MKLLVKSFLLSATLAIFAACNNQASNIPASGQTDSTAVQAEPAYKVAFSIMNLEADPNTSPEDMGEIASDLGFYMMEAKDELAGSGIEFVAPEGKYDSLPVSVGGKLVKYINGKNLSPAGECCGYVVAQNGKEPAFIAVQPSITANNIKAYFK